jgi:pimeloyl-ACP methyl ester carboxylesterase
MIIRSRQQLKSGSRWLLYPVFAVLLLASVGGVYETVSGAGDANADPIPGELIDVGGHRLHLSCTGTGSPTVVLEPGGGLMSSALGWIAPAVAADTQVCVYDRAGRGWSDPADSPQDATQIATDLHTLLDRGQVPGPYVLAGHSFGGLYVLTFAALYPDDVGGMVLVDSTAPAPEPMDEPNSSGAEDSFNIMSRVSALASASARVGLGRLIALADYGTLPAQSRDEMRASAATARYMQSTIDEYVLANASGKEAASLASFADKPLVVLTAGVGSDTAWLASQDYLPALSSNSEHRVIDGVNHAGLLFDEQGAAATTQAILDVVTSIRNDEPLVR